MQGEIMNPRFLDALRDSLKDRPDAEQALHALERIERETKTLRDMEQPYWVADLRGLAVLGKYEYNRDFQNRTTVAAHHWLFEKSEGAFDLEGLPARDQAILQLFAANAIREMSSLKNFAANNSWPRLSLDPPYEVETVLFDLKTISSTLTKFGVFKDNKMTADDFIFMMQAGFASFYGHPAATWPLSEQETQWFTEYFKNNMHAGAANALNRAAILMNEQYTDVHHFVPPWERQPENSVIPPVYRSEMTPVQPLDPSRLQQEGASQKDFTRLAMADREEKPYHAAARGNEGWSQQGSWMPGQNPRQRWRNDNGRGM
jgi:uncharacterized protein (DUF934 family)